MKIIELTNASPDIASLLDRARVDDIVVRMADGSEFLLVAVDDFDREIARTRANPRLMALLESRAKQTTTVSLEEAKRSEDWDCRVGLACCKVGLDRPLIPTAERRKGVRNEWHSVKLNTLGFKVLRTKTPAHRLIINNMISISLDPKPRVSKAYSIFYIRTSGDLC